MPTLPMVVSFCFFLSSDRVESHLSVLESRLDELLTPPVQLKLQV